MSKGFRSKSAPSKNQLAQQVSSTVDAQGAMLERMQQQLKFAMNAGMQTMQLARNNEALLNSVTSLLRMEPTTEGATNGDAVLFDFIGFLQDEQGNVGEEHFEGGYGLGHLIMNLGASQFLKDFEDGLVGMKAGDNKDVVVNFPADYNDALKGKKATFKISVIKVWRPTQAQTAVEVLLEKSLNLKKAKDDAAKEAALAKEVKTDAVVKEQA